MGLSRQHMHIHIHPSRLIDCWCTTTDCRVFDLGSMTFLASIGHCQGRFAKEHIFRYTTSCFRTLWTTLLVC